MTDERWVVLGLAHPRAEWFGEVARWSTTAAIPVDFVKCISAEEVRARARAGRAYSALLVGGDVATLDRDLIESVREMGAATIVVDRVSTREWHDLGVAAVLPADFDRDGLLRALADHAAPVARVEAHPIPEPAPPEARWRGRLVAVTGPGGTGTSSMAMALAHALSSDASNAGMVLLADLALDAELAMLHDAGDVLPGVQELTEAHQRARLPVDRVRSFVFDAAPWGYHLLLGLRRHRDWTAIRPRSFAAALDGVLRSYRLVVADVDADVEGESLTGSLDVEDRNTMARATTGRADVVVVVGHPTTKGLHALARTIRTLVEAGVSPSRVVPVCNRAPRNPRRRAEATAALAALLGDVAPTPIGNPVFVPERHDLDDAVRDGICLPAALGRAIRAETQRVLDAHPPRPVPDRGIAEPAAAEAVVPGSLGSWAEEAG